MCVCVITESKNSLVPDEVNFRQFLNIIKSCDPFEFGAVAEQLFALVSAYASAISLR